MAFRVVRQRREARKNAKIEEIFQVEKKRKIISAIVILMLQERDKNQTGKITLEQLTDIYRIYEVHDNQLSKEYNDSFQG